MRKPALAVFLGFCFAVPTAAQASQTRDLTAYVPANAPLVLDLVDADACLKRLFAFLEPLPKELPPEVGAAFSALPGLVRSQTGRSLQDTLETLAPGQLCFAVFMSPKDKPFPVLLSRLDDAADARRVMRKLDKLKVPWDIDGSVLTVSNKRNNLRLALRFRKSGKKSLLQREGYLQQRAVLEPGKSVRVYFDLGILRKQAKKGVYEGMDAGGRLLLGPIGNMLDKATRVDGRLDLAADNLRLVGHSDVSSVGGKNDAVGKLLMNGSEARKLPPAPAGMLACLSLDRDLGAFFENIDKLLKSEDAANVKTFISQADLFVRGTTFLDGVVAAMADPITVFVTDTEPEDEEQEPRIKLPAFSMVVPILQKNRKRFETTMKNALRIVTTLTVAQRTQQKKQPTLRLRTDRRDGYRFQYLQYGEWPGPGEPPTEVGLGVTMLFAHDHAILASTRDGAVRVANALKNGKPREVRGDYVALAGPKLGEFARKNIGVLALARVFKEGETLKEAQRFYAAVEAVAKCLEFDAALAPVGKKTRLELNLRRLRR